MTAAATEVENNGTEADERDTLLGEPVDDLTEPEKDTCNKPDFKNNGSLEYPHNANDTDVSNCQPSQAEAKSPLLKEEITIEVVTTIDDAPPKVSKIRTYKDLLVLSFTFTFNFTAWLSYTNLQSSINKKGGIGTTSLAVMYASLVLSSLFLAPQVLARASHKWIMVVSIVFYAVFMATGFHTVWETVLPGSVVIAIGK